MIFLNTTHKVDFKHVKLDSTWFIKIEALTSAGKVDAVFRFKALSVRQIVQTIP